MASMNYFLVLSRDYLLRVFYILMNKYLYNILLTNATKYVGNWPINTDSLSGIYTGHNTGKKTGLFFIQEWACALSNKQKKMAEARKEYMSETTTQSPLNSIEINRLYFSNIEMWNVSETTTP